MPWLPPPPAIVYVMPDQTTTAPPPQAPPKAAVQGSTFVCDETGVIRCYVTENVTAKTRVDNMRVIAKYLWLVAERNRSFYATWREKLPSAAYEVVRRIKSFPYLPYGDMYAIIDMQLIIEEERNKIVVRYPKRPDKNQHDELAEDEYVTYETDLTTFMKAIEKEIGRLKRYDKKQPQ